MAGAAGDALGYPVEFIGSFQQIKARYGEEGVLEFDLSYPETGAGDQVALFSDDTQMTLYTAEALLEAERRDLPLIPTIRDAYLAWYGGQTGQKVKTSYPSELAKIKAVNQGRAPGNTCLSALMTIRSGKTPHNDSKGCGGVMRLAPIGIYGAVKGLPLEATGRLAGEAAEITHQHPLSTYPSAMMAMMVQLCLTLEKPDLDRFREITTVALDAVTGIYGEDAPYMDDFHQLIQNTLRVSALELADWEIIEEGLGGGWVGEEAFAIALFSVLRHFDDIDACLRCAVNHGGDSDSTGAIAGNIIGAALGYDAIPSKYTGRLELRDLILSYADRLSGL